MKKLLAIAALLLASTAAQAQYTFEYGGRTIRVDPDRGTVSIPGVYDNTGQARPNARATRTVIATVRANSRHTGKHRSADHARCRCPRGARTLWNKRLCQRPPRSFQRLPRRRPRRHPNRRPRRQQSLRRTPTSSPPPAPQARSHRCGRAARTSRTRTCSPAAPQSIKLAAWRVADRGKGRQSPDRTVRHQPLRIFRRQEVEPERRTGSDQYEARQGSNGAAGFSIRTSGSTYDLTIALKGKTACAFRVVPSAAYSAAARPGPA